MVLSHPEFEAAVRQALRDYARPDRLAGNALVSSRLVPTEPRIGRQARRCVKLVRSSAEELNGILGTSDCTEPCIAPS